MDQFLNLVSELIFIRPDSFYAQCLKCMLLLPQIRSLSAQDDTTRIVNILMDLNLNDDLNPAQGPQGIRLPSEQIIPAINSSVRNIITEQLRVAPQRHALLRTVAEKFKMHDLFREVMMCACISSKSVLCK